MTEIKFYSHWNPYGCFSNFSNHPVMIGALEWKTSEHYFQAQKFVGTEHEESIRNCSSPNSAAKMGRDRSLPLRNDWEEVKDRIMFDVCLAKFTQHLDIRQILLDTGAAQLIEHTVRDNYWGDGGDGSGKNMLGIILMRVREALLKQ
jgi:hypothetical protein